MRYAWTYTAFFLLALVTTTKLFLRKRYRVVHVHSVPDFLVFVALFARLFGAKVILDLHEALPEMAESRFPGKSSRGIARLARVIESLSAGFADRVFVVSEAIREVLTRRGMPNSKLAVLPNSPEEVDIPATGRDSVTLRWGLATERLIVVAGGLNPERDLGSLLRALAHLPPSVGLLILGRGEPRYVASLRDLAISLRVDARVRFAGFLPHQEALSLLRLSDVGVVTFEENPITRLGTPNRLLEYAMLGKPVVAPLLPGIRSFAGSGAYYYRPGDPRDLARGIERALWGDNRDAVRELAQRYDSVRWGRVRQRLLDEYEAGRLELYRRNRRALNARDPSLRV